MQENNTFSQILVHATAVSTGSTTINMSILISCIHLFYSSTISYGQSTVRTSAT